MKVSPASVVRISWSLAAERPLDIGERWHDARGTATAATMVSNDLRAFYSIQERARAAAQTTSLHAANDVLATFLGLRDEARALHVRMGWPEAEFDQEVPPWTEDPAVAALRIGRWGHSGNPGEQQALLARAKHSLRQLAARSPAT